VAEVEAMSTVISISTRRRYGIARTCRMWGVSRAGIYRGREATITPSAPRRRPGPQGLIADAALVEAIRQVLVDSPFYGEGYRKVWARLRHAGLRTSKERVRRLMRENGLSVATSRGCPRGPRNHDGTIIPETVDTMWGTDMTATVTTEHGQVAVFVAVDHASAASRQTRPSASASATITGASTCPATSSGRSPGSAPRRLRRSSVHPKAMAAPSGSSGR
jgi:putative transposase